MENLEERDKRRNGTTVFNNPYSREAIGRLKAMIKTFEAQEKSKYYTILVDGEIVVDRTDSHTKFDEYQPFVTPYTKTVEIRMYLGTSPTCNRHIFHKSESSLRGAIMPSKNPINIQAEIAKALAEQKQQFELESTTQKLRKKSKQIKKLKQQLTESKTGLEGIQDLAGKAVQIAGMFKGAQAAELSGVQEPQSEIEIEAEEISEEEAFYNDLVNEVGVNGIKKALRVMELLSKHPQLEEVLNNELKKSKK